MIFDFTLRCSVMCSAMFQTLFTPPSRVFIFTFNYITNINVRYVTSSEDFVYQTGHQTGHFAFVFNLHSSYLGKIFFSELKIENFFISYGVSMTLSPIKTLNSEVKSCTGTISGNFSCENDFLCKKCTQIYQKVVSLPLKQILVSETLGNFQNT